MKELVRQFKKYRIAYLFLLPTVLAMMIMHIAPIVQGIYMAFLEFNQYTINQYLSAPFIGFENFYNVLLNANSPIRLGILEATRNTIIYAIIVTLGTLTLGMIVALMVNRQFFGKGFVRTLFLFPWVVPTLRLLCGLSIYGTTPVPPTGSDGTGSSCPPVTVRCCCTRCFIFSAMTSASTI